MTGQSPSKTANHSVPQYSPLMQRKHTAAVIIIEMVSDRVSRDATQWSGMEGEEQMT